MKKNFSAHPLNRYSEVFSALETRYTLLSMTYKKYIDLRHCCFIPGKVLDVAFEIVRKMKGYLTQNINPALDVVQILRDIRDYSRFFFNKLNYKRIDPMIFF